MSQECTVSLESRMERLEPKVRADCRMMKHVLVALLSQVQGAEEDTGPWQGLRWELMSTECG